MGTNATDFWTTIDSPLGEILLTSDGEHLTALRINPSAASRIALCRGVRDDTVFARAVSELRRYFAGKLTRFTVKCRPSGTAFQQKVWEALTAIPAGKTLSYEGLAAAVGSPKASRAVGNANGKNPIAIIVPCHRVIAKNGTIGGYTGGLEKKRFLLKLEGSDFRE